MTVTVEDLRDEADRLLTALDAYDQFTDGWPFERGSVPSEVRAFLAELDATPCEPDRQAGVALATAVTELYRRAREAEATYVQRARERGREDWSRVVAETEPVREATRKVHTAGYGADPETGEPGYLLPEELCPAHRVSMNAGSSPVTYADRVAQYRAVADRFDVSPEVVYHPGSGHDVSPSRAFPDSRVVYVDVDAAAAADLERAGYEAHGADATGCEVAGGADVIVFRNAGLLEEAVVASNLRAGGWVLANDHLESARHLSGMDSLELVGVVADAWTGDSPPVETVDPAAGRRRRAVTGARDERPPADRATAGPHPSTPFERWSPLDLYVFRNDA